MLSKYSATLNLSSRAQVGETIADIQGFDVGLEGLKLRLHTNTIISEFLRKPDMGLPDYENSGNDLISV